MVFTVTDSWLNYPADGKFCMIRRCTNSRGEGGVCLNDLDPRKCCCALFNNHCLGHSDVEYDFSNPRLSSQVDIKFRTNFFIPLSFRRVTRARPKHSGKTISSTILKEKAGFQMLSATPWMLHHGPTYFQHRQGRIDTPALQDLFCL